MSGHLRTTRHLLWGALAVLAAKLIAVWVMPQTAYAVLPKAANLSTGSASFQQNAGSAGQATSDEQKIANGDEIVVNPGSGRGIWARLWGGDALGTMAAIVGVGDEANYGNVFKSKRGGTVVVATVDGYWDALTASALAGISDAPFLQRRPQSSRLPPLRR